MLTDFSDLSSCLPVTADSEALFCTGLSETMSSVLEEPFDSTSGTGVGSDFVGGAGVSDPESVFSPTAAAWAAVLASLILASCSGHEVTAGDEGLADSLFSFLFSFSRSVELALSGGGVAGIGVFLALGLALATGLSG